MRKALLLYLLPLIAMQASAADCNPVPGGGRRSDPHHRPPGNHHNSIPHAVAPPRVFIARKLHNMYASVSMTKQDKAWPPRLQNRWSSIAHYSARAPEREMFLPIFRALVYNSACSHCRCVWQNCILVTFIFYLILAGPASRSGAVHTFGVALL